MQEFVKRDIEQEVNILFDSECVFVKCILYRIMSVTLLIIALPQVLFGSLAVCVHFKRSLVFF